LKTQIENILSDFKAVNLKDMDSVNLMKRKDSKYLFNINQLPDILNELKASHKTLEINEKRLLKYVTAYYDTPDLCLYYNHHNGRLNRFKVREREYTISEESFLEIKRKNNKLITVKNRTRLSEKLDSSDKSSNKFIQKHSHLSLKNLEKKLSNSFYRSTLVNFENNERLTIDILLKFKTEDNHVGIEKLVIAELKQDALKKSYSGVQAIFKKHGIRPKRISKYCLGTVLLNENVKYNRFKYKILTINKICNGELTIK
jgi:hypothetical protein